MAGRRRIGTPSAPIIDYVKRGGDFYTIAEVAAACRRDPSRIRVWVREGRVEGASCKMTLSEKAFVWIYTKEDMDRIVAFSKTVKMGRPKKEKP